MKNFEEMSYEKLQSVRARTAAALEQMDKMLSGCKARELQKKIAAVVQQIQEIENFIDDCGGCSTHAWMTDDRLGLRLMIDLSDIKAFVENIDPEIFFE